MFALWYFVLSWKEYRGVALNKAKSANSKFPSTPTSPEPIQATKTSPTPAPVVSPTIAPVPISTSTPKPIPASDPIPVSSPKPIVVPPKPTSTVQLTASPAKDSLNQIESRAGTVSNPNTDTSKISLDTSYKTFHNTSPTDQSRMFHTLEQLEEQKQKNTSSSNKNDTALETEDMYSSDEEDIGDEEEDEEDNDSEVERIDNLSKS